MTTYHDDGTFTVTGPFAAHHGNALHIQNVLDAIRCQHPFKSGSFFGQRGNYGLRYRHWLNDAEVAEYERVANHIVYTLISYNTPIAYAYRAMADGTLPADISAGDETRWHIVDQKFSVSTGRHQSRLRQALSGRRAAYHPQRVGDAVYQDEPISFEMI